MSELFDEQWSKAIFAWRVFEPLDQRPPDRREYWPDFRPHELGNRFGSDLNGARAWRKLVSELRRFADSARPDAFRDDCVAALDQFYKECAEITAPPTARCVFISHQSADTSRGERVACIAEHFNVNYWLDALLNCTHVIALHTTKSDRSRWIPYEFGRTKHRQITSQQAATWFEQNQDPSNCGEYLYLAVETYDEAQVLDWFKLVNPAIQQRPNVPPNCMVHGTQVLK